MRIAPLFLTLLKRYLGLKHLLTFLLDLFAIDKVLSGLISGLRLLPSLSVIIEISLSFSALLVWSNVTISNIYPIYISSLLLTASLIILQSLDLYNQSKVLHLFLLPLGVGYSSFQANVIQFGVDQLCDASSTEIKTFITWYSWTLLSSRATLGTACLYISKEYKLLVPLLVCLQLTLAVSLGILFNKVLIKEPVTQNPFKTVYGVIKYALKHKSPRLRSAFTYTGEEDLPSRIDFGKTKYGGPFTTEQVRLSFE